MTNRKAAAVKTASKPFLTGAPVDESTLKTSLVFFGSLILTALMSFLVSATTAGASLFIRVLLNGLMIPVILFFFFNSGSSQGTDAVARGEILYQRNEKGLTYTESEKSVCFHPVKGYLNGFFGTLPLFIIAVMLSLLTGLQTTDSGTLPSWIQGYLRRDEVGAALVHYTQPEGMGFVDYVRLIVRICIMPWINLAGAGNRQLMLVLERLSPLIVLLPAISYGSGYLTGKSNRTRIHTAISESARKRARRERKARKESRNGTIRPKGPHQLN